MKKNEKKTNKTNMFGIMNGYVEIAEKLVHSKYVAKTDTRELGISDVLPVAYEKEQEKLDSVYTILEYLRLPSLLQLELTIVTDMIEPPRTLTSANMKKSITTS